MTKSPNDRHILQSLKTLKLFEGLPRKLLDELAGETRTIRVERGKSILREGEIANALYIVLSGRFCVQIKGRSKAIAEIGPGQPIGEIAFLAGDRRTATVVALRESVVVRLGRNQFKRLCRKNPGIWQNLATSLAKRLADSNIRDSTPPDPIPRTIAVIPAGQEAIPQVFVEEFLGLISEQANIIVLSSDNIHKIAPECLQGDSLKATSALNALEATHDYVIYLSDTTLTTWSETAVGQADLVLSVGVHKSGGDTQVELNDIERFAQSLHDQNAQRLVLLHPNTQTVRGTARWLKSRSILMHHHLALNDRSDYQRLLRFIQGRSVGLIACGGGAHCASHIGLYKAFTHAGISFDIMGGTSGGAAMTAAFAMGLDPDEIARQMHEMFVTGGAMRRYTLPVLSLLDHRHFDKHLRKCYGEGEIEDLWIPYFAVATNLSSNKLQCVRTGKLWEGVRASGSIPALLPPFYTTEGEMLVDGGLMNNVPVSVMRELKSGPIVVVSFEVSKRELFPIDYGKLPSRFGLLLQLANPKLRKRLLQVPSIGAVLLRALVANRQNFERYLGEDDLLMLPPIPSEIGLLSWRQHERLTEDAYHWTVAEIARLREMGDDLMCRIDGAPAE